MSRSRKKNSVHGVTTARSDKEFKKRMHRDARDEERRVLKEIASGGADPEDAVISSQKHDNWSSDKDGKIQFSMELHQESHEGKGGKWSHSFRKLRRK